MLPANRKICNATLQLATVRILIAPMLGFGKGNGSFTRAAGGFIAVHRLPHTTDYTE